MWSPSVHLIRLSAVSLGVTANFIFSPLNPVINRTVIFDASNSFSCNGTHFLPIVSYKWNFGDGNITTTTNPVIAHKYAINDTYRVTLNVTDIQGLCNTTSQMIRVNLAEFSLVTSYRVHLDLDYWFGMGSSLAVSFYTYDGVYQENITVWTGATPTGVMLSTDIAHPQGKPIEVLKLVLTDDSGNVLQTVTSFVVHQPDLMGRLGELDHLWTVPGSDRPAIMKEYVTIDGQWPYTPP